MDDRVRFTVACSMKPRWIPHFLGMLKTMQRLGEIGASRVITFHVDGDGDFNPKFEWGIDVEPVEREEQKIDDRQYGYFFDAG
jgi:hypothetical protein